MTQYLKSMLVSMCGDALLACLERFTGQTHFVYQPQNRNSNKTCRVSMKAEWEAKNQGHLKKEMEGREKKGKENPSISSHLWSASRPWVSGWVWGVGSPPVRSNKFKMEDWLMQAAVLSVGTLQKRFKTAAHYLSPNLQTEAFEQLLIAPNFITTTLLPVNFRRFTVIWFGTMRNEKGLRMCLTWFWSW